MKNLLILLLIASVLSSCGAPNGKKHKPVIANDTDSSQVGTDSSSAKANQNTYENVKPIFSKYCSQCHPSKSQPNWLDYQQAIVFVRSGLLMKRVFEQKTMPPPGSQQAAQISSADRQKIADWIQSGALENPSPTPIATSTSSSEDKPSETNLQSQVPSFAQNCMNCHQSQRLSEGLVPNIAGQNFEYLQRQLTDFKWLKRINPDMNAQAIALQDDQISQLARYFSQASLSAPGPSTKSQETSLEKIQFQNGKQFAESSCNSCHANPDNNNKPVSAYVPSLVGQPREYLLKQLILFKNGSRDNALMQTLTEKMSQKDMEDVTTYFQGSEHFWDSLH